MEILFRDDGLRRLYEDPGFDGGRPRAVVRAFRRRVTSILAAADERDLRAVKGNHFEKLQGREDEYSIRLNKQWRLTVTMETRNGIRTMVLLAIEDYH